jgi:aryl-alcohol dehydrogenase-like predicted oxidoreductase
MDEYRPNDEVAKRLMRVAVDSGVRLFDTGEMYNNTHLLGQVLREAVGDGTLKHIGEVTIMTKVGRDEGDKCCDWGDNVTQQVEKQLRDLGVASLDLIGGCCVAFRVA